MREALRRLSLGEPSHLALAYDAWAPVGEHGKVPDEECAEWLTKLAGTALSRDYPKAFERWKRSFTASGDRTAEVQFASRLLVGHGNQSATDVGLTLHHTWGVPIIPGSSLKGLCAHYVATVYGPDAEDQTGEREGFKGVHYDDGRIVRGPGKIYRALFGAPDADKDGEGEGAAAGLVTFHDALYVPGSAPDDRPFAPDVLTVHQKQYYNDAGKSWPNDFDDPNPVAFLSVRPGVKLLLALSGPADWTLLAEKLLTAALRDWGSGGKTSSGYGRMGSPGAPAASARASSAAIPKNGATAEAVLLPEKTNKLGWKAKHECGLAGSIKIDGDAPAGWKAGDRVTLTVSWANKKEISFKYPPKAG